MYHTTNGVEKEAPFSQSCTKLGNLLSSHGAGVRKQGKFFALIRIHI